MFSKPRVLDHASDTFFIMKPSKQYLIMQVMSMAEQEKGMCPEEFESGLRLSVRVILGVAIMAGIGLGLFIYQLVMNLDPAHPPYFDVFLMNPPYIGVLFVVMLVLAFVVLFGLYKIKKHSCSTEPIPFFDDNRGDVDG